MVHGRTFRFTDLIKLILGLRVGEGRSRCRLLLELPSGGARGLVFVLPASVDTEGRRQGALFYWRLRSGDN